MNTLKKLLLLLCSSFILASCSIMKTKRPPQVAPPDLKSELAKIEIDIAAGAQKKALIRLKKIINKFNNTDLADDASIMMGELYYSIGDYDSSYKAFISVVNSDFFSPREFDALLWASKALVKLGRYDEALSLTDQGLRFRDIPISSKIELYQIRFTVLNQFGDRLDALRALIYLSKNSPEKRKQELFRLKAMDFIESRLSEKDIEAVADNSRYGFVRGYAVYRVAQSYFEQRDYRRAKNYFEEVIKLLPNTDLSSQSKNLIKQIDARRKVSPKTIGAILPLSGRHSKVGYRSLKGLQLGLGIYGKNKSSFNLAIIDSEGNPDVARRAVERLVTEDHVIAIVGSLLSKTSVAVAAKSDELGVPNIALSQKSGLTETGEYVFRNALTSESQIKHLVESAMKGFGLRNFAVLYPNDPYGVEYTNLFWSEVLKRGGRIIAAQPYRSNETDFRGPIQRMVGTYYLSGRSDEYKLLYKDWLKKQRSLKTRRSPPEELLPPIVDFDALFIPDNTKAVGQIAAMLQVQDVKNIKLLGTNLWNNKSLVKRGQKLVEGSLFVDGLLTSDRSFRNSRFYGEFKRIFKRPPGIFESQAYDAGLILRQIIASGSRSRIGVKEELVNLKNFSGSIGILSTNENRELKRPLIDLTVENGSIKRLLTK